MRADALILLRYNLNNLVANSPTGAAGSLRFRGCAYRKIRYDPEAADPAGGTPQPELKFPPWEYCKRTHPLSGADSRNCRGYWQSYLALDAQKRKHKNLDMDSFLPFLFYY